MSSVDFYILAEGETAEAAFNDIVSKARSGNPYYDCGIRYKTEFVEIPLPPGTNAQWYAEDYLQDGLDNRIGTWGRAGCISVGNGEFLFFGWAPS